MEVTMEDLIQLDGKNIVVMGVANERSIAWGVAESLYKAGAKVIYTYRLDRSREKLEKLLEKYNYPAEMIVRCDVNSDESISQAFTDIGEKVGTIHGLVHSVAFANADDLKGDFIDTSRDGYAFAQDTSAYSLVAAAKAARPYLADDASIITMSYLGAVRALPGYNVMGIAKASLEACVRYLTFDLGKDGVRINAISAGPIRTLAAKGVPGFNDIMKMIEEKAPLKRNVTKEDVGNMSVAMLSNLSRGVTGEVIYVDSGYNIVG